MLVYKGPDPVGKMEIPVIRPVLIEDVEAAGAARDRPQPFLRDLARHGDIRVQRPAAHVGDQEAATGVQHHGMHHAELSRPVAILVHLLQELAVPVEPDQTRVPVPVRDHEVATR